MYRVLYANALHDRMLPVNIRELLAGYKATTQKMLSNGHFYVEYDQGTVFIKHQNKKVRIYPNAGSLKAFLSDIRREEEKVSAKQQKKIDEAIDNHNGVAAYTHNICILIQDILRSDITDTSVHPIPPSVQFRISRDIVDLSAITVTKEKNTLRVMFPVAQPYADTLSLPSITFPIYADAKFKRIRKLYRDTMASKLSPLFTNQAAIESQLQQAAADVLDAVSFDANLFKKHETFIPKYCTICQCVKNFSRPEFTISKIKNEHITFKTYGGLTFTYNLATKSIQQYPWASVNTIQKIVKQAVYACDAAVDLESRVVRQRDGVQCSVESTLSSCTVTGSTVSYSFFIDGSKWKTVCQEYVAGQPVKRLNAKLVHQYNDGIVEYRRIKRIKEKIKKEETEKALAPFRADVELYGNPLVRDIYILVSANRSFITEASIISGLRGVTVRSSAPFQPTDGCGVYNFLSGDYIAECVQKMCHYQLLHARTRKGDYGYYATYEPGPAEFSDDIMKPVAKKYPRIQPDDRKYTYADWEQLLLAEFRQDNDATPGKDWQKRLPLLEKDELFCKYQPQYLEMFSRAPETVRAYIRLAGQCGNRICRKISKVLI